MNVNDMQKVLRKEELEAIPIKMSPKYLDEYNFKPDVVIDVGAQRGTPFPYNSFPDTKFVLIDPPKECRTAVQEWESKISLDFHNIALGETEGEIELQVPVGARGKRLSESSFRTCIDGLSKMYRDIENGGFR